MNGCIFIMIIIIFLVLLFIYQKKKLTYSYYIHGSNIDKDFIDIVRDIIRKSEWNRYFNIRETNSPNADIKIKLINRNTANTNGTYYPDGSPIYYSYTYYKTGKIEIDSGNWLNGVKWSNLNLRDYREYVINHELGHAFGYDHVNCSNGICPVMYQATKGCYNGNKCMTQPSSIDLSKRIE